MSDPLKSPEAKPLSSEGSLFRRLLLQSGQLFVGQAVALVVTLIQGILVARYLGPTRLGLVALVVTFVTTVSKLVDSRVWEATVRWVAQFQKEGDNTRATAAVKAALLIDVATAALAFLLIYVTADWFARLFLEQEGATGWIRLYGLSLLVTSPIGPIVALLRLDGRYVSLAAYSGTMPVARLVATVVVVQLDAGIAALLSGYVAATVVSSASVVSLGIPAWRRLGLLSLRRVTISSLRGHRRSMARFVFSTSVLSLLKIFQKNAEVFLVGLTLSAAHVGRVRIARSLTDQLAFATDPIYQVSYPEYVRLWSQGSVADLRRVVMRVTALAGAVGVAGFVTFLLLGHQIVSLTVGPEYLGAVPVIQWLAGGACLAVSANALHPLLLAMGRAGRSATGFAIAVLFQMGALVTLVPTIGIVGVGVAYVTFYLAWILILLPPVAAALRDDRAALPCSVDTP